MIWERCSAEPGTEECHSKINLKKKKRLGRKKGGNSLEKGGFGKKKGFFSLGSSLGYAGGVEVVDDGTGVQVGCVLLRGVQPAPGSGRVWSSNRRGMRALSDPVGQLNPHPAAPTE